VLHVLPISFSLTDNSNYTWWTIQVMKLLIMQLINQTYVPNIIFNGTGKRKIDLRKWTEYEWRMRTNEHNDVFSSNSDALITRVINNVIHKFYI
jgi:hypothetical protein